MKNSNHASKALAVVLSGALAFAPAANAALDESNMAYTSAAEGFYGSLRVQYANNDAGRDVDNDATVEAEGSRLGVRGDIDLGGGLGAFYGFEWNLGGPANGDKGLNTRQHHVGLKGDWGSVWLGAFDSVIVRFGGFSTTDILDQYSGNFEPIYRTSNAVAYVSPDLNGFNFGVELRANDGEKAGTILPGGSLPVAGDPVTFAKCEADPNGPIVVGALENGVCVGNAVSVSGDADDGNDFDKIGFGANYSIQGLTFSGAYYQEQDALPKGRYLENSDGNVYQGYDDNSRYALGLSYSQDNWIVAGMFGGQDFASDYGCVDTPDTSDPTENIDQCNYRVSQIGDATFFSLAAGVSIDKLDIHGLWEQKVEEDYLQFDSDPGAVGGLVSRDQDTTITAITARYHLGSKARLRAGWKNTEEERGPASVDTTSYALGMRVDF